MPVSTSDRRERKGAAREQGAQESSQPEAAGDSSYKSRPGPDFPVLPARELPQRPESSGRLYMADPVFGIVIGHGTTIGDLMEAYDGTHELSSFETYGSTMASFYLPGSLDCIDVLYGGDGLITWVKCIGPYNDGLNVNGIAFGMTQAEAIAILGQPDLAGDSWLSCDREDTSVLFSFWEDGELFAFDMDFYYY